MVAEVATIIKVGVRRHLPDYFVIVLDDDDFIGMAANLLLHGSLVSGL